MTYSEPAILFAADTHFSVPLGLAVQSLIQNALPETLYRIFILDDGIRRDVKKDIDAMKGNHSITYINVSHLVGNVTTTERFPKVAFARFLISELLPPDITGKVFYTDADILFCEDITHLGEFNMQGKSVASVQSINMASRQQAPYIKQWKSLFSLKDTGAPYFFSSSLLFDMNEWKQRDYEARILELGRQLSSQDIPCPDQDIYNAVCHGDIALLPARYCVIPSFEQRYTSDDYQQEFEGRLMYSDQERHEAWHNPALLHYAAKKPSLIEKAFTCHDRYFLDFWQRSPWKYQLPYLPRTWGFPHRAFLHLTAFPLLWLRLPTSACHHIIYFIHFHLFNRKGFAKATLRWLLRRP